MTHETLDSSATGLEGVDDTLIHGMGSSASVENVFAKNPASSLMQRHENFLDNPRRPGIGSMIWDGVQRMLGIPLPDSLK